MKKVTFGAKPASGPRSETADDWVMDRERSPEPLKRLTIDIPARLHRRVKSQCAIEGEHIADVVREFLEGRFPEAKEPFALPNGDHSVNTEIQNEGQS
jgi:hypothetical protein